MCRPYHNFSTQWPALNLSPGLNIAALSHRRLRLYRPRKKQGGSFPKWLSIGVISLEKEAQNHFAGRGDQSSREVVRKKGTAEEKDLEGIVKTLNEV